MGASSESLAAIGGQGMEHTLAAVRGAVWVTGKSKEGGWEEMGRDDMEGGDGKMFSNPSLPDN